MWSSLQALNSVFQCCSPLVDVPFPDETQESVRATMFNLQPETTYNVSVTTVAKGKRGQAKVVTFTTGTIAKRNIFNFCVVSMVMSGMQTTSGCNTRICFTLHVGTSCVTRLMC